MSSLEVIWTDLLRHRQDFDTFHLRDAFAKDPHRFNRYSAEMDQCLTLDYSRNRIDEKTMMLLELLLEQAEVRERFSDMLDGGMLNPSEKRPVLHAALRSGTSENLTLDGQNIAGLVHSVLDRMVVFSNSVRDGSIVGKSGQAFTDIVNIGIGGSDFGPHLATKALTAFHDGPRVHFISNVDGSHLQDCLRYLNPETTLFVIASKTFTTLETMKNAKGARAWLVENLGPDAVSDHFVALSANERKVQEFGIDQGRMFEFWDWVGGRYSVWSAIGLPIMLAIGADRFLEFLDGAKQMDEHFASMPFRQNLPLLMAGLGLWYRNVWACSSHAILPYDQRLALLPGFLQQLDMESNGKSVRANGKPIVRPSGPVIWGAAGTGGQHAFFQALHQGSEMVPCDFLVAAKPTDTDAEAHNLLLSNCLAQIEALAFGRSRDDVEAQMRAEGKSDEDIAELAPHKVFMGNRPSNLLFYDQLTPKMLGRLIALYEHKVFAQGVVWGVNSFDQWGVELGKEMANKLMPSIETGERGEGDPAILQRLKIYRAH